MTQSGAITRFEKAIWPHLGAAYNLARWLTHRDSDAEDVVQEAMLRAFKFFDGYRGCDARAWLLTIVRNTAYTWLRQNRSPEFAAEMDIEAVVLEDPSPGPDIQALERANREQVRQALAELPLEFREVLVLRELEGLSYKEICEVAGVPMGTVMSRLARARDHLQRMLLKQGSKEKHREL